MSGSPPGAIHLVIARGNGRRSIVRDNADRNRLQEQLGKAVVTGKAQPEVSMSGVGNRYENAVVEWPCPGARFQAMPYPHASGRVMRQSITGRSWAGIQRRQPNNPIA